MILKQLPEDFIVKEIPIYKFEKGNIPIFLLEKTNYPTEKAIQTIAKALNIPRKNISYAGLKDKRAITTQYISIKDKPSRPEKLKLSDIKLTHIGYLNKPLSLGELEGNEFQITVRNLPNKKFSHIELVPNYYDEQRFSENNLEIGLAIIKKDYEKACEILKQDDDKTQLKQWLDKHPSDFVNALKTIPIKILQIYPRSFQSHLFNLLVDRCIEKGLKNQEIPIPGFASEYCDVIRPLVEELLEKYEISSRDFILRDFPRISLEGAKRSIYVKPQGLSVKFEKDELNEGYKAIVNFKLAKGAYATNVVKHLFKK